MKMKKAFTLIGVLVLVGSLGVAVQAQSSGRKQWVVTIPFHFRVGDETLPAGQYTIAQVNPASDRVVLEIRMKNGSRTTLLQMRPIMRARADQTVLVFHRYYDQYFFAEAWIKGESEGLNALRSSSERAAAKDLAARNLTMEAVALKSR
jgi:hypothetical protein